MHVRLLDQRGFDFGHSTRKPRILTSESFLPTNWIRRRSSTDQIIRAIEALVSETRFSELVRNEPIGRQLGPVEIAARDAGAADKQLAGFAGSDRLRSSSRT